MPRLRRISMANVKTNAKSGKPTMKEVSVARHTREDVLLSIQDLRVWFELRRLGFGHAGFVHAVDGVSFDLHKREAIAVVGESGCGKSSLMKTILGLYRPTKGHVVFQNKDISKFRPKDMRWYRSQVGYIQQDPYGAMAPFMTVDKILHEPMVINNFNNHDAQEKQIQKVMAEVKMMPHEDFLPKFPHMLSGGQQQRIVIARAMMLEPGLIVADEPVSMLDASVRVEILKLLRGLQEKHNMAVIYITHDLSTVRYFSRRIFVMYAGKLVEKAKVHDLLYNPSHPYTLALLAATSDPDAKNAKTFKDVPSGEPPNLIHPPTGCRFHPRCPKFMKGVCDVEEPPEFEVQPDHQVACWLFKKKK
jgi:peptide/nickel transport system ATP-binding protein